MKHFQHFKTTISGEALPDKFTFPFYYDPHPLAKIATTELQDYLVNQTDFKHNFGLEVNSDSLSVGKMFGVLVVKNKQNEIGYLAAFSGKLADKSLPIKFVPPVFNMRTEGSFYIKGELEIDAINAQLGNLKKDEKFITLKKTVQKITKEIEDDLSFQRKRMKLFKTERKIQKKKAIAILNDLDFKKLTEKLTQESYNNQFFLKELQEYYLTKVEKISADFIIFEAKIASLKKERKEKSNYLQQTLFSKYAFLIRKKN